MPGAEILLVEDDDLNQALVPAILARSDRPRLRDAHVIVAGTLARAREVLAGQHIDLVLLDMHLPDGSGLPFAAELRDQEGSPVAVIALTGAPAEHRDDALAAGCVAVMGKPYSLAELRDVVAAHLPHEPGAGPAPGAAAPPVDFALLFAGAPGMCVALDPDLRIVAVSDAYARTAGVTPADLVGRSIWEALPEDVGNPRPGALPGLRDCLERVRANRSAETMGIQKCFMPPPEAGRGTYDTRYFRAVNVPVFDAGANLCYIVHTLEDVTGHMAELDQARRAERAAQDAKTEYVNRVSHELRTPINTILGFGELLSLGDLTAEHREWATMMATAAKHLASFVDDIADISRAERHKLSVSIEPVPAGGVIDDALNLIRPLAASHGVYLEAPAPASQHVFADPRRLRQVLLNLLSNAVKYNHPAGQVRIGVDVQPGDRLRISIRDTGRGIADSDIGQLFTPFQRLDAAQAGIEGAGLGLTLSRQLIEAMGGTIGATSAPGEGSVFWVELPVAQPAAAPDAASGADPVVEQRAYTAPKTILYVEDMLETLLLVEHILKQRPSTSLVPAMLGGAALDLAAEYRPHLILLDLNLPDIPGEELLRRLKADPATSATPVVVISAESAERRDGMLAMGASAYLAKPISVRDFLNTVDTLLTAPPAAAAAAAGDRPRVAEPQAGQAPPRPGGPGRPPSA